VVAPERLENEKSVFVIQCYSWRLISCCVRLEDRGQVKSVSRKTG
jgi:hypothetical protein